MAEDERTRPAPAALGLRLLGQAFTGRLCREYIGAAEIPLQPHTLEAGAECLIAPDLVAQCVAPDGGLLATRGYHLYELDGDGAAFRRRCRLPCRFGKAWLGHFSAARQYVHRSDIIDLLPLRSGAMLVSSGGRLYRGRAGEGRFQEVFKLRRWGPGVGRGVRPAGMAELAGGTILFGEYFANPNNEAVHVFASDDGGMNWAAVHVFPPGRTRHIHALQEDPFTGWVWICAGDANDRSFVAYSQDEGGSFHEIGGGGQLWRVCRLLFTEGHVYWGADTNLPEDRCIVRWSRQAAQVEKLAQVGGPVLGATRLAGGTWVFATDREGTYGQQWFFEPDQRGRATEWDDVPSLWISPDAQAWKRLKLSPWLPETKPAFGVPQIAVGSGADRLAVTCLNMARYDNKLLLFQEQQLRRWFDQAPPEEIMPR